MEGEGIVNELVPALFSVFQIILLPDFLRELAETSEEELDTFHFGFGLYIRNNLLVPGSRLYKEFEKCGVTEKDDMSSIIIKEFHAYLKSKK